MPNPRDRRPLRARRGRSRSQDAPLENIYFGTSAESAAPTVRFDKKALQLCRQVREQLDLVLAELDDPVLDGVAIADVVVAGDGHTLRVDVIAPEGTDVGAIHTRLDAARGRLRSEIASAIHRKRAPVLGFAVIPAAALRNEEDNHDD